VIGIIALAWGSRVSRRALALLTLQWCTYVAVFHQLSNTPLDDPLLAGVHARFWQQPNVTVFILSGVGMSCGSVFVVRQLCHGWRWLAGSDAFTAIEPAIKAASLAALVAWGLFCCGASMQSGCAQTCTDGRASVQAWGEGVLASLPKNSILLSSDDLTWGSISCVMRCVDCVIIHTLYLLSFSHPLSASFACRQVPAGL